ncbi:MAG: selenocysteine-specific translation elongation factor [Acidobacteria bacterium]|nr:selenocysteine-specific translation elongation factor [Acidobacteriota bacterium]
MGTAGHIDHGKTALVRALTGIETDRLKEEKARGISIDLGFAHLDLPGPLRAGFVDVPGHERFVKNMLAGVTGIDIVLFVVSAEESIKPQTREHFDICRLLGLERGIIALTKTDLVDAEMVELVRMEVEELVAGSFLESASIHAVSAITGAGLPELRAEIARLGSLASGASKPAMGASTRGSGFPFRLPVDRAFAMRGFGAVVTGTVAAGTVRLEDELELYPDGHRVRVRGIQAHGAAAATAGAGQRTAINLAGVEVGQLRRGQTLAPAGVFRATRDAGVRLEMLEGAPPLKARTPVHFHVGTAEVEAEIRLLDAVAPYARLVLAEPLLLLPGDRFILRRFSPVETIGGGWVIDPYPPQLRRGPLAARLERLDTAGRAGQIKLLVEEAPFGLQPAELLARGFTTTEVGASPLIDPARVLALRKKLAAVVAEFHREHPLAPGMPKEELRSRELAGAPATLLDSLLGEELVAEAEVVRLKSHRLHLKQDEDAALTKIENAFAQAGLAVPAADDVLASCGVEAGRAKTLLSLLLRDGRLVRIGAGLIYHRDAVGQLKQALAARRGQRFGVAEFKEWTGVSRKFAIPLLEFLDRERITRRDGDARLIA